MKFFTLLLLTFSISCFGQKSSPNPDQLYTDFTLAYDKLNSEDLAELYLESAVALNLYDGGPSSSIKGRVEIQKYFNDFFSRFKKNNQNLRLTFKIEDRQVIGNTILDNGFYKLEFLTPNRPSFLTFGKFSTELEIEDGKWKFKTDATTNTDFIEYENCLSPTLPERDEVLFPDFYDDLLGDYKTENGNLIVIGRSPYRLYAFNPQTNEYRGLNKVNPTVWTSGNSIISKEVQKTYKFTFGKIEISENDTTSATAIKQHLYTTQKVVYLNSKGVKLGGTLFIPKAPNGKAIVLVHGSGPQERNGYAGIIRLLADVISRDGTTVLTYDKQGVGQSEGNWESENFSDLANDALAGVDYLKSRKDLSIKKIGLGGSSQAGWIIAKAIEARPEIDFVLTIGAAGSGVSVIDQNLYNTKANLKCDGSFSDKQIDNILTQQKYFFDFLKDPENAAKLDKFTNKISNDPKVANWLFPISSQVDLSDRNQWFTALEVHFDPLPIWRSFKNPTLMVFSEFDDSTPTSTVISRIESLNNSKIKTHVIQNAQHIGLKTKTLCDGGIGKLDDFHSEFFYEILNWLKNI